jgi:predicted phosphodiesterase
MSSPSTSIRRLIGDVHGYYDRYKKILKESPYPTIQVGDMGVGFRRYYIDGAVAYRPNPPYDLMVETDARFIRGNHDNPETCRKHTQWIMDGTFENGVMYIGGALSIDKAYRTEGYDYWSDEELSQEDLEDLIEAYIIEKPQIMVTHECPQSITGCFSDTYGIKLDRRFDSRTRHAFDRMFGVHQPKLWVFGHWHNKLDYMNNGTRFICLPELETIDIDFDKVEVVEPSE